MAVDRDENYWVEFNPVKGSEQAGLRPAAQIATIQQDGDGSRLRPPRGETGIRPVGKLGPSQMKAVDRALQFSLGLG